MNGKIYAHIAEVHQVPIVGPLTGLDAAGKRTISSPCQESNTDRPAFRYTTVLQLLL
jgi:hypothetical protein